MSKGTMHVTVRPRTVYGRDVYYPINTNAQIFADLMGRKTFDYDALCKINLLPLVHVSIEHPEVKL